MSGGDRARLRARAGPDRRGRLRAFGLVAPLLIFVGVTFMAPLATMLVRSV
ncbi:MAG: ABC transporter permease, partial [Gemmatimonadetes bacterium]|nr:ABC transporter permease [Gemmatimonadota bacterium]